MWAAPSWIRRWRDTSPRVSEEICRCAALFITAPGDRGLVRLVLEDRGRVGRGRGVGPDRGRGRFGPPGSARSSQRRAERGRRGGGWARHPAFCLELATRGPALLGGVPQNLLGSHLARRRCGLRLDRAAVLRGAVDRGGIVGWMAGAWRALGGGELWLRDLRYRMGPPGALCNLRQSDRARDLGGRSGPARQTGRGSLLFLCRCGDGSRGRLGRGGRQSLAGSGEGFLRGGRRVGHL